MSDPFASLDPFDLGLESVNETKDEPQVVDDLLNNFLASLPGLEQDIPVHTNEADVKVQNEVNVPPAIREDEQDHVLTAFDEAFSAPPQSSVSQSQTNDDHSWFGFSKDFERVPDSITDMLDVARSLPPVKMTGLDDESSHFDFIDADEVNDDNDEGSIADPDIESLFSFFTGEEGDDAQDVIVQDVRGDVNNTATVAEEEAYAQFKQRNTERSSTTTTDHVEPIVPSPSKEEKRKQKCSLCLLELMTNPLNPICALCGEPQPVQETLQVTHHQTTSSSSLSGKRRTPIFRADCCMVTPQGLYSGIFSLFGKTSAKKSPLLLCFWGFDPNGLFNSFLIDMQDIGLILPRQFKLRRCALELSMKRSNIKYFLNFRPFQQTAGDDQSFMDVHRFNSQKRPRATSFRSLSSKEATRRGELMRNSILRALCTRLKLPANLTGKVWLKKSNLTTLWIERKISNFEYLVHLNQLAGRTFLDISQYPIFPWIISDYTSKILNLEDPSVYRDLSLPVGALNPVRWQHFEERFRSLQEDERHAQRHTPSSSNTDSIPPFMYGSHYSNEGIVLYYLLRQQPYTTCAKNLQGGKFDLPDRLFSSIPRAWELSLNESSDVKELIPEFFSGDGSFLRNPGLDLGTRQDGTKVDHVTLPPWANNDAKTFIQMNRKALDESDYVSTHLNEWIDLIFGYKQQGSAAIEAKNVFFYLTYTGRCDVDAIDSDKERKSVEDQIAHFGQTPLALFSKPHPIRKDKYGRTRASVHDEEHAIKKLTRRISKVFQSH